MARDGVRVASDTTCIAEGQIGDGRRPATRRASRQRSPVLALLTPPGALRRPARHLVHATATVVGVSLALATRMKP